MRLTLKLAFAACLMLAFSISGCTQGVRCTNGDASARFPLEVKWCLELASPIDHPPRIHEGVIYVRTSNSSAAMFYAIDTETSNVIWTYQTDTSKGLEPFLWEIVGDNIVIADGLELESLNRLTGKIIWHKTVNTVQALTTDGETLYLAASGYAQAIDATSGKTLWEYRGLPSHRTFRVFYDASNSRIVIPAANQLHILEAKSGRLIYLNEIEYSAGTFWSAILNEGKLSDGAYMLDVETGRVAYRLPEGISTGWSPLVYDGTLYYFTTLGGLASFDLEMQSRPWLYFPEDGESLHGFYFAILNGYGYILASDDSLRAIRLTTGEEIGRWFGTPSSFSLAPRGKLVYVPLPSFTASRDSLYASFGTNLLYAFEVRDTSNDKHQGGSP